MGVLLVNALGKLGREKEVNDVTVEMISPHWLIIAYTRLHLEVYECVGTVCKLM